MREDRILPQLSDAIARIELARLAVALAKRARSRPLYHPEFRPYYEERVRDLPQILPNINKAYNLRGPRTIPRCFEVDALSGKITGRRIRKSLRSNGCGARHCNLLRPWSESNNGREIPGTPTQLNRAYSLAPIYFKSMI
jgi:hypothetical protein